MSHAKLKGNRLESFIAKLYQRKLDKDARRMPMSGAADGFKGDILKRFRDGWVDECKSRKKIAIYDWWQQAIEQCGEFDKPVLHIKADNKPVLTVIRAEDYFDLREELYDYIEQFDNIESEVNEKDHYNKVTAVNKLKHIKQVLKQVEKLIDNSGSLNN